MKLSTSTIATLFSMLGAAAAGTPKEITVMAEITITNLAPSEGTFLTPVWAGIHNGAFDLYDRNKTVTVAVERLAEDGNTALLMHDFSQTEGALWDSTLGSAPIAPGETVTMPIEVTYIPGWCKYFFSYASMVIPSNDFWVANGNPMAYEIIDELGNFMGTEFIVMGDQVLDAGTEVNDEDPTTTAFFGQASPDTGVNEDSYVTLAEGFKPVEEGGILADEMFANADFTAPGYQIMSIKVSALASGNLRGRQ
jgi:Spondin_N